MASLQTQVAEQAKEIQELRAEINELKEASQDHAYDIGRLFREMQKTKDKLWRLTQTLVDGATRWGIDLRMCF